MTYSDYGSPTDSLASPSLSQWAGYVAAALTPTTASLTLSAPWENYVAPLKVTRQGTLVTVEGFVRVASGPFTVVASTSYGITSIPAGFRPASDVSWLVGWSYPGTYATLQPTRCNITPAGAMSVWAPTAGTIPTAGGWLFLNATYRAA